MQTLILFGCFWIVEPLYVIEWEVKWYKQKLFLQLNNIGERYNYCNYIDKIFSFIYI